MDCRIVSDGGVCRELEKLIFEKYVMSYGSKNFVLTDYFYAIF